MMTISYSTNYYSSIFLFIIKSFKKLCFNRFDLSLLKMFIENKLFFIFIANIF